MWACPPRPLPRPKLKQPAGCRSTGEMRGKVATLRLLRLTSWLDSDVRLRMAIYALGDLAPQIDPSCFVAREATIIGNVTLGAGVNVWPGAVLRGDVEPIRVGPRTSIQDNAVLHTDPGCPLTIGSDVTVGHQATLHGCSVGDGALIGMQAIVLNRASIGDASLVGAGALVTEGKAFPSRRLILGCPAKDVRPLDEAQVEAFLAAAERYVARGALYREQLRVIDREEADRTP